MKKLVILISISITHHWLSGQPNFEILSNKRNSEYYCFEYRIPHGVGGASFDLLMTQALEFSYNISDSPPKSWNKRVGGWFVSSDTIIFFFDQKIPRVHEEKIPKGRKYKPLILKWSGGSSTLPAWRGRPLEVEANLILLLDVERTELADTVAEILKYFRENFDDVASKTSDQEEIFEINQAVEQLARNFCAEKKVPYAIKIYFNGNLQKNF